MLAVLEVNMGDTHGEPGPARHAWHGQNGALGADSVEVYQTRLRVMQ